MTYIRSLTLVDPASSRVSGNPFRLCQNGSRRRVCGRLYRLQTRPGPEWVLDLGEDDAVSGVTDRNVNPYGTFFSTVDESPAEGCTYKECHFPSGVLRNLV